MIILLSHAVSIDVLNTTGDFCYVNCSCRLKCARNASKRARCFIKLKVIEITIHFKVKKKKKKKKKESHFLRFLHVFTFHRAKTFSFLLFLAKWPSGKGRPRKFNLGAVYKRNIRKGANCKIILINF